MGFSYFYSAEFIRHFRGPRKSMIFGESRIGSRLNCGRAAGLFDLPDECDCLFRYRNPLAKPLLTIGIFRRWLLSCILMSRVRLCFGRVVRLLERAEESCEGLKHGYYDLPCVYFLIFLCHDIKNKIDRLVLFKRTKFLKILKIILERAKRYWNTRKALLRSLYCLLAGDIISVLISAFGTPAGQTAGYYPGGGFSLYL